jgi:hypothetical protein
MKMLFNLPIFIREKLSLNENVTNLVGDSIYPLVINDSDGSEQFPSILYNREGIDIVTTKDRIHIRQQETYSFSCQASTYSDCIDIIQSVSDCLLGLREETEDYFIVDVFYEGISESFSDDCVIVTLTLKFIINLK